VLDTSRSGIYGSRTAAGASGSAKPAIDENLAQRVHGLAREHPTFGYRRLWAMLRFGDKVAVNIKKVHRLVKVLKLQVRQRLVAPRPRVQQRRSSTTVSNERWAMDVTHVYCGAEGWGHLAAVIDCHDRQIVGYEFALRGRSQEAERALEAACLSRFGTVRPLGKTPTIRSDNGLIFTSRRFREACRFYRLHQEFITPYTPEQNGLIERFFRSLKEECVWQHNFGCFAEARAKIRDWIGWYRISFRLRCYCLSRRESEWPMAVCFVLAPVAKPGRSRTRRQETPTQPKR
jgi:putative transposase